MSKGRIIDDTSDINTQQSDDDSIIVVTPSKRKQNSINQDLLDQKRDIINKNSTPQRLSSSIMKKGRIAATDILPSKWDETDSNDDEHIKTPIKRRKFDANNMLSIQYGIPIYSDDDDDDLDEDDGGQSRQKSTKTRIKKLSSSSSSSSLSSSSSSSSGSGSGSATSSSSSSSSSSSGSESSSSSSSETENSQYLSDSSSDIEHDVSSTRQRSQQQQQPQRQSLSRKNGKSAIEKWCKNGTMSSKRKSSSSSSSLQLKSCVIQKDKPLVPYSDEDDEPLFRTRKNVSTPSKPDNHQYRDQPQSPQITDSPQHDDIIATKDNDNYTSILPSKSRRKVKYHHNTDGLAKFGFFQKLVDVQDEEEEIIFKHK